MNVRPVCALKLEKNSINVLLDAKNNVVQSRLHQFLILFTDITLSSTRHWNVDCMDAPNILLTLAITTFMMHLYVSRISETKDQFLPSYNHMMISYEKIRVPHP